MADNIRRCQCPPPLEFPENVKREMKYEELEHRRRESELYAKIIELQIENANLKGDKETLSRVVSHRDKMLMEIRVQLQAMEFFCRENNIKVDIEMCSDEVIENWSFKESDEIYQRILLITQDLLRAGSKCLQENMASCRSGSQQQRSTRSSSSSSTSKLMSTDHARTNKKDNIVAGLSESVQLVTTSDQGGDAVLFKETSRPGTVKLDLQSLLKAEQEFNGTKDNKSTVSYSNLAEINAGIAERNGRRALDDGDYRSTFFRPRHDDEDDSSDDEDEGDDGDESQESEFEELGEDMIKYVELQPSVGPRRDSRSSSFSRMAAMTPYGGSSVSTPDMSTAVLMKNLWSNGAARQSSATTPLQHPSHQMQHRRSGSTNRSSGGSILSNGSLIEEYFTNGPHSMEQASSFGTLAQSTAAPIGLGMAGLPRTPERISIESFSAPPTGALPSVPTPRYSPVFSPSCSPPAPNHLYSYAARSPLSNSTSAMFHSQVSSSMMGGSKRNSNRSSSSSINRPFQSPPPPPMAPIPPLPTYPRLSHREQTKQGLLESKRSFRGRTVSHGFAIEDVGQFLERKTYGKLLTRDPMHQGHRRQISV
ncbi:hypothetical protein BGX27_009288 [Mortierella sp. AM989]|nr:hypothetical protein BGX27_009288 [Mortierella sp. AM989]